MVRAARGLSRELYTGILSLAKVIACTGNKFDYHAGLITLYSVISSSHIQSRLCRLIFVNEGSTSFRYVSPQSPNPSFSGKQDY